MPSDVIYLQLKPGSDLPALTIDRPFKAVLTLEEDVSAEWREIVSAWLVGAGCLYMMAWGNDCAAWHDSVDLASLQAHDFAEAPDGSDPMTTWHDDETLQEVFWFSKFCAMHSVYELTQTLLLDVSAADRRAQILKLYAKAISEDG